MRFSIEIEVACYDIHYPFLACLRLGCADALLCERLIGNRRLLLLLDEIPKLMNKLVPELGQVGVLLMTDGDISKNEISLRVSLGLDGSPSSSLGCHEVESGCRHVLCRDAKSQAALGSEMREKDELEREICRKKTRCERDIRGQGDASGGRHEI